MIGKLTADVDFLFRLAAQVPVIADELERGIVRFRSRIGKQDVIMPFRQQPREFGGEFHRVRVRGLEEVVVIGKYPQRFATGVRQFLVSSIGIRCCSPLCRGYCRGERFPWAS